MRVCCRHLEQQQQDAEAAVQKGQAALVVLQTARERLFEDWQPGLSSTSSPRENHASATASAYKSIATLQVRIRVLFSSDICFEAALKQFLCTKLCDCK